MINDLHAKELQEITRRTKAYSSSCSQTVSLSPVFSWILCCSWRSQKSITTPYFGSSRSFKVVDVDTTEKLVASACCDRQHAHVYLQPFSWKTGQQQRNNDFYGDTALWCPSAQVSLNLENCGLDLRNLRLMLKTSYAASLCLS